jgi:K+-transporting ATPase ATPase B chain
LIPADGGIVEGIASVNESAITGESAPGIRESGGDRSAVTGGTTVLSDWVKVKITVTPGNTFIDRMIALVEGAERKKTPNELALSVLLAGMTLIFLIAVTLWGLAGYSGTVLQSKFWWLCWLRLFPQPSAAYCRPSALPAWTG